MGPCDNAPRFHQFVVGIALHCRNLSSSRDLLRRSKAGSRCPRKETCTRASKRCKARFRSSGHDSTIGILLAGGRATRMGGGDKALKTLRGVPLLARVIALLRPQCDCLIISANGEPARFARFGAPIVVDDVGGFAGPLAGILAGLDFIAAQQPQAAFAVSVATDTPFLPTDLVTASRGRVAPPAPRSPARARAARRIPSSPFGRSASEPRCARLSSAKTSTRSTASWRATSSPMPIGRLRLSTPSSTSMSPTILPPRGAFWRHMAIPREPAPSCPDVKDMDAGISRDICSTAPPISRARCGMSIGASGSVHSTIKRSPGRRLPKRLAGEQNGQRTFQPFEIETRPAHGHDSG